MKRVLWYQHFRAFSDLRCHLRNERENMGYLKSAWERSEMNQLGAAGSLQVKSGDNETTSTKPGHTPYPRPEIHKRLPRRGIWNEDYRFVRENVRRVLRGWRIVQRSEGRERFQTVNTFSSGKRDVRLTVFIHQSFFYKIRPKTGKIEFRSIRVGSRMTPEWLPELI
ncbi:hypothetical protein AVEN_185870-1 [Araneus ventricosus]|uniref:Uncharacterized protein n=1 Tax=Araneus ventricosus TaxID=182803 RepID=A0A4Y2WQQ9_ARAVE|nr:hypothetical protein AVEN_185870-1 [Araneus ventricosus]